MEVIGFLFGATRNKDLAMLMIFLGCFFAPSFVRGLQNASTCSLGWLNVSCDAGEAILIKDVFRGSYISGGQRCSYQSGDGREYDVNVTKVVWKDCNLRSKCDVLFTDTGNYYLEMDYDCVSKKDMNMTSVCNGTLKADHGYIHSPCYPHMATLRGSNAINCKCTTSVPTQTFITVKIFHQAESLVIYWNDSYAQLINQASADSYKEVRHKGPFSFSFASAFEGTNWDRVFWLEYSTDSEINMTCTRVTGSPAQTSCQIPSPESTTSTTTAKSTLTEENSTTEGTVGPGLDIIPIVVGTVVPLLIIAAGLPTVIILLRKRRQAASGKATTEDNEGLELTDSIDTRAFVCDPESGERLHDSVALSLEVAGASSLYSSPDELDDKIGHGEGLEATEGQAHEPPPSKQGMKKPKSGSRKRLEADKGARPSSDSSAGDRAAPKQTKPMVKQKPSLELKDAGPSSDEMEPTAAIYAIVDKKSKKERPHKDEKDPTLESGSNVDPGDLYTKVNKSDKRKRAPDSNNNKSVLTDDILEAQTGDVYALVDKTAKRGKGKKPEVPPKRDKEGTESDIPMPLDGAPSVVLEQAGVVYAQVDKTTKQSKGKKLEIPPKRDVEGAESHKPMTLEGAPSVVLKPQADDVYAQVDKTAKQSKGKKPEVPPKGDIEEAESDKPVTPDGASSVVYAQVQKGNKLTHKSKPVTKSDTDAHDQQGQLRPASSNDTDLYSRVDDDDTDAQPGGDPANDSDDDLYSSVDDKVDEDYGYAYAQGRRFDADNEDPDYGEVGDVDESEDAVNQSEENDGVSESD